MDDESGDDERDGLTSEWGRDKNGEADEMNLEVYSNDNMMHIYKWAICDFQVGDGWRARKSDNRWGASTARRLKSDKVVKIARLSDCKNFVSERERERSLYSMHPCQNRRYATVYYYDLICFKWLKQANDRWWSD